ncbi:MAG TPA: xanthine dehydrogenase family protein molybdopterin-binding subunit [Nitrososphaerales archaeon]|nr:xanthine dehydrogenase family protein molybdopterin-binding subunit [Nitrososphaerales archaeon]
MKYSGLELKRKEDPRLISGHGTFVDDVKLPHMLYASFARSHLAHARIKRVDVSKAKSAQRGVELVLTGADKKWVALRPHIANMKPYVRYALASNKVRYEGEPVAVVLAQDRYAAEDAADSVEVEYETLPVVSDTAEALKQGATLVHEDWGDNVFLHYDHHFGDADKAISEADGVVTQKFKSARYTGSPIEPRSMVASYDQYSSTLTVWVATQMAHGYRSIMAELLGIPENKVRVIAPDVGGAFGVKTSGTPEDVMVCALSIMAGRPVKWIETRTENLVSSVHCHEIVHEATAAFNKDGRITALKTKITADIGAYVTIGGFEPVTHSWYYLPGQYKLPAYSVDVTCVATNKASFGAVRGFGRVVGAFVMERLMDIGAKRLGLDPVEIRYRNLIRAEDFPYTSATGMYLDKNSFSECMDKALVAFEYSKWRAEQGRLREKEGRYIGIGFSSALGPSGLSASKSQGLPGYEQVRITMDPQGKATLYTGVCPHGQGHETVLSQVAADELGVTPDDVTVVYGDTSSTPYGIGTWSDRSALAAGSAAILASRKLKEKIIGIASYMLGLPRGELVLNNGSVTSSADSSKTKSLGDIARVAYYRTDQLPPEMEPGLEAFGVFDPPNVTPQDSIGRRNESPTYSNSMHIVAVEVDPSSGQVKLLKYVIVHDSGFVINPAIVDGIIHGCIAQGVGTALFEELLYTDDGQLASSTFMDYLIPSAESIPPIEILHVETPSPSTLQGIRGAGQSGSMATPAAIANAVEDALSPFGVRVAELPMTQERIWRLLAQGRAS